MNGCTRNWLAGMLALTFFCGGSATAWSQEVTLTSAYLADDDTSLADRIGSLEAGLKSVNDKAAAAKKKAAGKPSLTMGGRIMADWTLYSQDAASKAQWYGDQQNGFEFRRARLFAKGTAFHVIDYKAQYDFASGSDHPAFKDVYIAVKELPVIGHLKVGHFKEAFGLEELTSSKYITFMERSLTSPFTPGRNVGIAAYNHTESENATWAVGAFCNEIGENAPVYRGDANNTAYTGRVTWLPWYDEATNGRGLFHLGAAYSYRNFGDGGVRYRERPEAHLGSRVLDTGTIPSLTEQIIGLEAAFVYGPFSIQSEYMRNRLINAGLNNPEYEGAYVMVSYFLTGENRPYKRTAGAFSRVKPFENFFRVRGEDGNIYTGKGAWEIAYRCSYLDLGESLAANAGNMTDHTFGVNWYLNPYTRIMFNYVNSNIRTGGTTGSMDIIETRAQIDW